MIPFNLNLCAAISSHVCPISQMGDGILSFRVICGCHLPLDQTGYRGVGFGAGIDIMSLTDQQQTLKLARILEDNQPVHSEFVSFDSASRMTAARLGRR